MRLLQIAWRNAKRQPRRTGLTAGIVALGVAALQFAWAVFDAGNSQMIDNMTSTFVSHVQVHGGGYDAEPSLERTFKADEVERTLVGDGRIQSSAPRLEGGVLISGAENARGILLVGVDPSREPQVTRIKERIVEGRYLRPEESGGVLLGQTLARSLGVKVGDEIAVVTEALHGAVGAGRYTVRGLFSTGNELIDRMQAHVSLPDARNLFGVENEITTLAIRLVDRNETDRVSATLNSRLGKSYEALGWPKLLPSVAQSIEFHKSMAAIIMVVLFSIVIIGVANALMMAVHERTREYGVMGALGTPPAWMFRTILYEGMLTGGLGFAVGGILGSLLVGYFAHFGLNFGGEADAFKTMQGGSSVFYLIWSADRLLTLAAIVLVVSIVGSLYPAWRVARLTPVSAMKGITSLISAPKSISPSEKIPLTLLLAWRNLLRQPVRTTLTIGAISMGLAAIVFLGSFANGYTRQAVDNVTGLITGDAQILRPEFRIDAKASLAFEGDPALDAVRRTPGVIAATGRVQIEGTLSTAKQFEPALLIGVDPERETEVTFLHRAVKLGRYLNNQSAREIVLGRQLAESLAVRQGEKVIITVQNRDGDLAAEAFRVAGLFDTGLSGLDEGVAYIHVRDAQRLLSIGGGLTNIALRLDPSRTTVDVQQSIQSALVGEKVKLYSWKELLPEVEQLTEISRRSVFVVLAVALVMIAGVVGNTLLMSVAERTKEFGILLALGTPPKKIVRMVLLESVLLACVAMTVGLIVGLALTLAHMKSGVNMAAHGATPIAGVTNIVFPRLSWSVVIEPMVVLPIVVLLAAWWPARRASRMEAVDAIRH